MSGEIKVDPKLLISTAEALAPATKAIGELHDEWQLKVANLRKEWQGDTSDDVRNTAGQVAKSTQALLKSFAQYQTALRDAGGIFAAAESEISESTKSLDFGSMR